MNRLPFLKFRNKFARFSKLNMAQIAILAPVVYGLNDKYFVACEQYLDSGKETDVFFDEYSVLVIKESMQCTYIEALVILSNMEKYPEYACYIYTPRNVE